MAKKTTPIITYTEILNRAIGSIEAEINECRKLCEGLPQAQKDAMFAVAAKDLMAKLNTLKTLYCIETGADYDGYC